MSTHLPRFLETPLEVTLFGDHLSLREAQTPSHRRLQVVRPLSLCTRYPQGSGGGGAALEGGDSRAARRRSHRRRVRASRVGPWGVNLDVTCLALDNNIICIGLHFIQYVCSLVYMYSTKRYIFDTIHVYAIKFFFFYFKYISEDLQGTWPKIFYVYMYSSPHSPLPQLAIVAGRHPCCVTTIDVLTRRNLGECIGVPKLD